MTQIERRRQFFKTLEAKSLRSRPFATRIADKLTTKTGTPTFLFLNGLIFFVWIYINLGFVSQLQPFDPFPFGLLTMLVSLEAIFLAIFVLISQNRQARISTIREEMHLRINLIAENEITKILELLAEMRKKMGIQTKDPELEQMLEQINANYIETSIADQMSRADRSLFQLIAQDFPAGVMNLLKKPVVAVKQSEEAQSPEKQEEVVKEKLKVLSTK